MGTVASAGWPWRLSRREPKARTDNAPWRSFWESAKRTSYYHNHPRETCLDSLAPVPVSFYYENHAQFLNPAVPWSRPVPLSFAWNPLPRTVIAKPWFRVRERVRVLPEPCCESLRESKPELLAAPVEVLRGICQAIRQGRLCLRLSHSVVALTGLHTDLEREDRDEFWSIFRVPVYEQLRGYEGEVLGTECEAHSGLHFDPQSAHWEESGGMLPAELWLTSFGNLRRPAARLATGLCGWIDQEPCDCGSETPRIVRADWA